MLTSKPLPLLICALVLVTASASITELYPYDEVTTYPRWGTVAISDQAVQYDFVVSDKFTAAVTEHFAYGVSPSFNIILAYWIQGRGKLNFTSIEIPGLNNSRPILSVPPMGSKDDSVYFVNEADSRIYCFNAFQTSTTPQKPKWTSKFKCQKSGGQQLMSIDVKRKLLLARCNGGIAVVNTRTGAHVTFIKNATVTPYQPIPFLNGNVGVWQGSTITSYSAKSGKKVWSATHPGGIQFTNVASEGNVVVMAADNWPWLYTLDARDGKILSHIRVKFADAMFADGDVTDVTIQTPTITVRNGIAYGTATGVAPLPSGAPVWMGWALDVTNASQPVFKWTTQILEGVPSAVPTPVTNRLVYISDTVNKRLRAFKITTGELYWWYYKDKGVVKIGKDLVAISPWTANLDELAIIQGQAKEYSLIWEQAMNINLTRPAWLSPGVNF